jgi:transcription initiation factor IIE alpha subunit
MMERLLDNAILAYNRCRDSGSEWGMQYWANVQKALLRKYSSKIH